MIGHFSEFDSVVGMLKIWEGGISLLGGIAGAVIVNVPRVRREGYRFFQVADPSHRRSRSVSRSVASAT